MGATEFIYIAYKYCLNNCLNCHLYRFRGLNLKNGASTTSVEPDYDQGSIEVSGVTHTTTAAYQSEDISSAA